MGSEKLLSAINSYSETRLSVKLENSLLQILNKGPNCEFTILSSQLFEIICQ